MKLFLRYLLLICLSLLAGYALAQETVDASTIIAALDAGEDVALEGKTIEGVLDFTRVADREEDRKKGGRNQKAFRCHVRNRLSFTNCTFRDDVIAYRNESNQGSLLSWGSNDKPLYNADFHAAVTFRDCEFREDVNFKYSRMHEGASFAGSRVEDAAGFKYTQFLERADFSGITIGDEANFKYTEFPEGVSFVNARFRGEGNFKYTKFPTGVDFSGANFDRSANFKYVDFAASSKFDGTDFGRSRDFKYTKIGGRKFNPAAAGGR